MGHMNLNIDLVDKINCKRVMLNFLLTRYPTPHSSALRTCLSLLLIIMFLHACCCSNARKQPLAQINTGTKLLLNSAVSAVTQYLFTNPLTSNGYWVYLGMSVLEVNPGNNMLYKTYVYDQTTVSYRICLNVGRTGSTTVYYKVEVRYFEYLHSSLYSFGNCMVDLKFFNVTTPALSTMSGSRKQMRNNLAQSAYMSRINKIKCIPHLAGVSISTQYDLNLAADCDASFVYLDISSSGQSLVDWVIVYVLCIDLFAARLHLGLNVEYGQFLVSNGNVVTYPLIMPNMVDSTTTSHLYGITSLNIQANLRVALSLAQPLLNLLSIPYFEYNYLYLNKLSCSSNTDHLNLATQQCNPYYNGFQQECGQMSMGSVRKVVGDGTSGATKILRIGQWKGTKIVAVATSAKVYLYIGDSNQALVRLQNLSYNSSITDIRFSEQPLILVVASQDKLMTYKFGDHSNRFSPYVTISIPLNSLCVLISPNALKISAVYRDANNSQHLITYSHNTIAANFVLIQDFDMALSSTSQIDMVWDHNATRLLIFNSFSHVMLQDTANNGQFSSAVTAPSIYKLIDDGLPIYAALSTDAQVLVVSVGRWKYSNDSNSYQGSLHIYRYDFVSNGYRLQQILNNDKFYSSINGGQQVSMSAQGLILVVQALSSSKKYQLIYRRDSISTNFVLNDVINEGLSTSVSETGIAISDDGQLFVTPYDGNNILAYYCKNLYVASQQEQSTAEDCCTQDIEMPKQSLGLIVSGSIMGSVLFCCLFVFLKNRNKEKKKVQCKIIAELKKRQSCDVNELTVSGQLIANVTQDQICEIMNGLSMPQGQIQTKSLYIANELVYYIGGRENAIVEYYGQTLEGQEIINGNVGDSIHDARNQASQCVEQQLNTKNAAIQSIPHSLPVNQLAQEGLESQIEQKLSQQQEWVQQKAQEWVQQKAQEWVQQKAQEWVQQKAQEWKEWKGEQEKEGVRQGKGGKKQKKKKKLKKVMIIYEQVGQEKQEEGKQEEIKQELNQQQQQKKQ